MTPMVGEIAILISGSPALSLVVKATMVAGGVLLATHVARRGRAAVRHLLLATAFVLLLTLPVASMVVPPREVSVPVAEATAIAVPSILTDLPPVVPASPPAGNVVVTASSPALSRPTFPRVSTFWVAGSLLFVFPLLTGFVRIRRLRRDSVPWRGGHAVVAELAKGLGVRVRIEVLLHEAAAGPMTCGVLRPALVLPPDARHWDQADLRRAIVHELEHIRRGDWFILCLARLVCALYWFHPLVWMAWRRLRLEAEKACDDAVLREALPETYADQLVTLAERVAIDATHSALAMANRGDLFARISAVLDEHQARGRAGARWIVVAGVSGVLLLAGVAPLRAVVTPRPSQQPSAAAGRQIAEPTVTLPPGTPAASPDLVAIVQEAKVTAAVAPVPSPAPQTAASAKPADEAAKLPRFDVVSVKVNDSGGVFPGVPRLTPGRATLTNVSLRQLIQVSHNIQPYQLVGLPQWADSARFDITATSNTNATPAELLVMVRGLLVDRFQFSTRRETRQLDTYSLVEVSPGSAKLRRSEANCAALANAPLDQALAAAGGRDGQPRCQILPMTGRGRLIATGAAMNDITNVLNTVVGRLVVDKTGLSGPFDVNLAWTPDPALQAIIRQNDPLSVPDAPSIFTAVEEQLGLRLVADHAPVDVTVVERLERPTPD